MAEPETSGNTGERLLYHYPDEDGYKAISSQKTWKFVASQPRRADNPVGAYFTNLPPDTPKLAKRLGVSKEKTRFFFEFMDEGDLLPLTKSRRPEFQWKFYSPADYLVGQVRQGDCGENPAWT